MRPADAYRARHRSPADAYRAKYRDAGSIQSALADLRVDEPQGVASAYAGRTRDSTVWCESFCDITGRYLRLMSTGVPEFDALMIQLHCWMKVLTQVGLKREAVGQPEGGERAITDNSFMRIMFLAQDAVREIVQKGW